ncbi:hypothetical protein ASPCADRAFT_6525 [Aspergillus carbonarius ITEM 5010]|uniref:Uncharacterized protein n=1 Tax=Aspergillus carbonarius (strain ITEM 5010) TaxID=602072 RepID=A0A1R3RK53_ASPC5|nr:hypothetical protein ASPCADRAFT_6525 [Aspergillus carbonarius ITEM 5010]
MARLRGCWDAGVLLSSPTWNHTIYVANTSIFIAFMASESIHGSVSPKPLQQESPTAFGRRETDLYAQCPESIIYDGPPDPEHRGRSAPRDANVREWSQKRVVACSLPPMERPLLRPQ